MSRRLKTYFLLPGCALVLTALIWTLVRAEKATTQALGGGDRYLTAVSTDKPLYRAGEKVYARGVLLNAASHKPLKDGEQAQATIEIKGPKGDTVASGMAASQDSVWGFAWEIPAGQPGGEYTLKVTYPWNGHAPAERKFDIRAYRAPRLKSQITFLRDGYGPGEKVTATLDVKRAEGGAPEGANVTVTARVDGQVLFGRTAKVDAKGLCSVSFDLPREIPRGEGTLALIIEDGGVVETAAKTIPILLQTVDLQLFPEGGDLVAGYTNRVYIEAKQPNGKPADLEGEVVLTRADNLKITSEKVVGTFRTEHEGRGRFEFQPKVLTVTPGTEEAYMLRITKPGGIKTTYALPQPKAEGAIVRTDKDTFAKGQPVTVQVGCTAKVFKVTLSKREVELAAHTVDLTKRTDLAPGMLHPLTFDNLRDADGVLIATVWDEKGAPLAERLLFREPAKKLNLTITPDRKFHVPGDSVKLTLKATDEAGKPVAAVVGVTVTDDAVLEMIEKREQAARLPVMVLLEPEVKELADAQIYLDEKNPKAPLAVDLLLGTQGWRRFAFMDAPKFIAAHGDPARRALALRIQSRVEVQKADLLAAEGHGGRAFEFKGGILRNGMALPAAGAAPIVGVDKPQDGPAGAPVEAPPAVLAPPAAPAGKPEGPAKDADDLQKALEVAQAEVDAKEIMGARAKRPVRGRWEARSDLVVVREYAHAVRPNRKPTDRVDFAETLYWNAGVKTDAATGEATVGFALNDSVTTFRVFADGFGGEGALGAANLGVESVQPFYAEPKLPLEVTAGDMILLPIGVVNATGSDLAGASVSAEMKGDFKVSALKPFDLAAFARARQIMQIKVGPNNGFCDFVLLAKAGLYEDKVTRKLSVKPRGFPIEVPFGGMIGPEKPVTHTLTIPPGVVARSLATNVAVYPTPLANMTEALQRLIQDPSGCFEQTSSTSYPLTMAQQYFLSHTGIDPKLVQMAREKLDAGYQRLVGFWCPDRGYEWFGQDPGHEALTAFGLLHFTDMAQVREVDRNMIDTTRAWLLKQKDGQGGFTRKRRALHTWIEDKDCSNAYILWALLEAGQPAQDLRAEIAALKTAAAANPNTYVTALAANVMFLTGDKAEATKLADKLAAKQNKEGGLDGATATIVGSGGEALTIEATSLATLGWLRDPNYAGAVEKGIKFLADSCKAGRYGSTQSTVLALRAIVTYDKARARPKAPGQVRILVDGQPVGDAVNFDQATQGAIKLPDVSELLTAGEHKLELRMTGGGEMPYSLAVNYNALVPASSKECKLDLKIKLAQERVAEGAATEANVTVINKANEVVPTPVAIIGLPGGLEVRHDQLKELVKKGTIDAYEVLGREVVLYWRTLPAGAKVDVPLSLIAAVPGEYTGPASRTYLYYTDEHKQWVDGVRVTVEPK